MILPVLAGLVLLGSVFVFYVGPPGSKQRRITTGPLIVVIIKCHTARFVAAMEEAMRKMGEALLPAIKRANDGFAAWERAWVKAHDKNKREPW